MSQYHFDIVLINPTSLGKGRLHFPMGSLALGSYLESKGFHPFILDFSLEVIKGKNLESITFPNSDSGIYGVTVYYGQLEEALRISKTIKSLFRDALIVLGGPGVHYQERYILNNHHEVVDLLVSTEGELILEMLLESKLLRQKTPGVWYFDKNKNEVIGNNYFDSLLDLDKLPFINFSLINLSDYFQYMGLRYLDIIAGFGCPFDCSFCSTCLYWNRVYRVKSPERIYDEMKYYYDQYEVTEFHLVHDHLFASKKYLESLLKYLMLQENKFNWNCAFRLDSIQEDTHTMLRKAGCDRVDIGIEHLDKKIQEHNAKVISLKEICYHTKKFNDCGIEVNYSFVTNLPYETVKTFIRLIQEISKLASSYNCSVYLFDLIIFPGTKLYGKKITRPIAASIVMVCKELLENWPTTAALLLQNYSISYLYKKIILSGDQSLFERIKDLEKYIIFEEAYNSLRKGRLSSVLQLSHSFSHGREKGHLIKLDLSNSWREVDKPLLPLDKGSYLIKSMGASTIFFKFEKDYDLDILLTICKCSSFFKRTLVALFSMEFSSVLLFSYDMFRLKIAEISLRERKET